TRPIWPKPNIRVTSRKVEVLDFADRPKGEAKKAESRVEWRAPIGDEFVATDAKAKSSEAKSRVNFHLTHLHSQFQARYFVAGDTNVGFGPCHWCAIRPKWRIRPLVGPGSCGAEMPDSWAETPDPGCTVGIGMRRIAQRLRLPDP